MGATQKRLWPALALFFLAPAIGELLSGSAPPLEFFHPLGLLILTALYGGGAILVRELRVRWGKGWPTVFLLGAAYGILEEGLMVKSFFDPEWMDLGPLGSYGRWAGVNWVWSIELTIYHAVFSIAIPILLVELAFPKRRSERWIGRRGMTGLAFLLLADVLFVFFLMTTYRPPVLPYLLAIALTAALILLARQLPPGQTSVPAPSSDRKSSPLQASLVGFFATLVFFVIHWLLPELGMPVLLTLIAVVVLVAMVIWTTRRMSRGNAWADRHRLALASGALAFFILLAPLQALDTTRVDNPAGMTLVGLAALLFLLWLGRRVRHTIHAAPPVTPH